MRTLHNGMPFPERLESTLASWDQSALTSDWLDSLPTVVSDLCRTWAIEIDQVLPDTYITLVALGHSAELGPVVIKSSPLAHEFIAESTALQLAASEHVPRLYYVDRMHSVMVMERIVPGTQLKNVAMSDEDATRLAAELVVAMWQAVPESSGLHPLVDWMSALFEWSPSSTRISQDLIAHAQEIGRLLLAKSTRICLLHGDLQHHNILQRSSGEWVIIDPKGLAGDPGYEVAAWMYNPPGIALRDDYAAIVECRVAIYSDVWDIEAQDLISWAFVGSTLNACWSSSDSAPDEWLQASLRSARQLRAMID